MRDDWADCSLSGAETKMSQKSASARTWTSCWSPGAYRGAGRSSRHTGEGDVEKRGSKEPFYGQIIHLLLNQVPRAGAEISKVYTLIPSSLATRIRGRVGMFTGNRWGEEQEKRAVLDRKVYNLLFYAHSRVKFDHKLVTGVRYCPTKSEIRAWRIATGSQTQHFLEAQCDACKGNKDTISPAYKGNH